MGALTLQTFLAAADDWESSEYRVLGSLQAYNTELHRNKLFPAYSELTDLVQMLESIIGHKANFENYFPQKYKGLSLEMKKAANEAVKSEAEKVFEFIKWALPKLKETVEEGKAILEFVEKNVLVEEVGMVPIYNKEGYLFVKQNFSDLVKVYRFKASIILSNEVSLDSFKTYFIESYVTDGKSLEEIKYDLMTKYSDLPNPAAYKCETEFNFPMEETILPVVKKKIMDKIAA
ncbi:MAG TPA: hypothetical protein VHP30_12635 [Ignavibacteriales bacterium]|jgi:hypothetical protein|nr:hypothetical protein [Ignavibacteriales bacterium]